MSTASGTDSKSAARMRAAAESVGDAALRWIASADVCGSDALRCIVNT
jgi:hypothetical protein